MRTLLLILLLSTVSVADTVYIQNDGQTNQVSPIGWFEHYYTEQECIDFGLPMDHTNKVWWCHPEDPIITEETPYIYIRSWECTGEHIFLWTDDLKSHRWYYVTKFQSYTYSTTFKLMLPDNSPIARRIRAADTSYFKHASWNTNCIFRVDASDLRAPSTGGGGTGGGGGGPPPLPASLRYR